MLALLAALCGVDLLRKPESQALAHGYTVCVEAYHWAKPRLGITPCCRFVPSCSRYSEAAVQRFGLPRGIALTAARLRRCRTNIAFGTPDPLPGREAPSDEAPSDRHMIVHDCSDT